MDTRTLAWRDGDPTLPGRYVVDVAIDHETGKARRARVLRHADITPERKAPQPAQETTT